MSPLFHQIILPLSRLQPGSYTAQRVAESRPRLRSVGLLHGSNHEAFNVRAAAQAYRVSGEVCRERVS